MDMRILRRIIKEFEKSSLTKLEITEKELNIKLEKDNNQNKDQVKIIESYNQPLVSVKPALPLHPKPGPSAWRLLCFRITTCWNLL